MELALEFSAKVADFCARENALVSEHQQIILRLCVNLIAGHPNALSKPRPGGFWHGLQRFYLSQEAVLPHTVKQSNESPQSGIQQARNFSPIQHAVSIT
jgi:hypothetical protein